MLDNLEEKFEVNSRRSLIVWVYSLRQLKVLRKYGIIAYVSKKMKYVIIYMDEKDIEGSEQGISKLHFVRNVERSYRPDIEMNFGDRIGESQMYDDSVISYDVEESKTEITLVEMT